VRSNFHTFSLRMSVREVGLVDVLLYIYTNENLMKNSIKVLFAVMLGLLISCGKSQKDAVSEPVDNDANQALYNEVMDIHDEVMPKMDDLYKMKKEMQSKLADSVNLNADQKSEMKQRIQELDSASNSMMVWMRQFNPPTDSTDTEGYREYMETQLELVKKMREEVLQALAKE
jgi:hypothetical protein